MIDGHFLDPTLLFVILIMVHIATGEFETYISPVIDQIFAKLR